MFDIDCTCPPPTLWGNNRFCHASDLRFWTSKVGRPPVKWHTEICTRRQVPKDLSHQRSFPWKCDPWHLCMTYVLVSYECIVICKWALATYILSVMPSWWWGRQRRFILSIGLMWGKLSARVPSKEFKLIWSQKTKIMIKSWVVQRRMLLTFIY